MDFLPRMHQALRRGVVCLLLVVMSAGAGCVSTPASREPLNLSAAKAAVMAYHESGAYAADVAAVAAEAETWLIQRVARAQAGERLAVVFDIDETVLSNYPHLVSQDFGYVRDVWVEWVARAEAEPLPPLHELFQLARRLGLHVVFITGRKDPQERLGTERNLAQVGLGDFDRLILAAADDPRPTAERKAAARAAVEAEGFTIIANLGDQDSDLRGGHAERTFKLPNPFYQIP
jgi:predicted secreted acid phosphatase